MDSFFKQNDAYIVKDALLSQLAVAVKELQVNIQSEESNSDNSASFLLTVIEAIFIHGLKETLMNKMSHAITTDLGQRPDPNFWAPLMIFSHRDVIRQICSLSQINTDVGRSRAWLRLSLNEGLLSSYIHSMSTDTSSLKPYYNNNAFVRDNEKIDLAKQLIKGIEICEFSLVCNSSLLNVWTNMPLLMAAVPTGPLRSCPVVPGTDVAQAMCAQESVSITTKKSSSISMYSYSNHVQPTTLMVDEDEALKLILGTPVIDSPIQTKVHSDILHAEQNGPTDAIDQQSLQSTVNATSASTIQSYNSLLSSYNKVVGVTPKVNFKDVVQQYQDPLVNAATASKENSPVNNEEQEPWEEISGNCGTDFEFVPATCSTLNIIPEYTCLVPYLSTITKEQGLDAQNYSCWYCQNPIGVNLENVRFCCYTGEYYCKDCFGKPTEQWIIPARVVHNWDFRKYPVSQRAEQFLIDVQHHPLLDFKVINPRIYVVIDEMAQLQALRMQLNLLRGYLFTCRQPVGETLKKQIWPNEYLYEHVHLYSVSDLLKIPSGSLIVTLEKAVNFSRQHVLTCSLCKEKGFICEICSVQTVIYPFDIDSTYKCCVCNAVYHATCLNCNKPCPKCERQKRRQLQNASLA